MEMERLTIRLSANDRATLDRLRGRRSAGAYLRGLIRAAAGQDSRSRSHRRRLALRSSFTCARPSASSSALQRAKVAR
jgi:hypothetical protein